MSDAKQLGFLMRDFMIRLMTAGLIDLANPRRICVEVEAGLAEETRDRLAATTQHVQREMLGEGEEPLAEQVIVEPTDHGRALLWLLQK
jgi:hypothetical protein